MKTTFEPLRLEFVEYLSKAGFSPDSVRGYGYHVRSFLDYLTAKGIKDVRRAGVETVKGYKLHLTRRYPNGFWNISIKLRAAYNLSQFLVKTERVIVNPCKEVKLPKLKKTLPHNFLSTDEAKRILDQPDLTTPFGLADRAILEVLYSTGLRVKEMAGLSLEDVDFINGTVIVRQGKWAKDRVVPLGPHALKFVDAYLKKVRPKYAKRQKTPSDALWLGNAGRPLSRQIIARRVLTYGRNAGIKGKKLSPHVWRHTFAMSLIRGGADVRHVQEFLGHSRTTSTLVYTKVTGADVKKAHDKCYPAKADKAMPKVRKKTRGHY
jgi:integrase/recombinase XerD